MGPDVSEDLSASCDGIQCTDCPTRELVRCESCQALRVEKWPVRTFGDLLTRVGLCCKSLQFVKNTRTPANTPQDPGPLCRPKSISVKDLVKPSLRGLPTSPIWSQIEQNNARSSLKAVVIDALALRSGTTFQLLLPIPHTKPAALDYTTVTACSPLQRTNFTPYPPRLKHCDETEARLTLDACAHFSNLHCRQRVPERHPQILCRAFQTDPANIAAV
jgi:hypothetical protein